MNLINLLLSIVVSASIDSTTLSLGDQTDLHLRAICAPEEHVLFPVYGETLIPEVEIVDRTIIDTMRLNDGRVQMDQYLTLTSFKDSLFYIPPVPFVSGDDTLYSSPLSLNVIQPFEMDTTEAITDIKPVMNAPVWVWGTLRWVLLALLVIALGTSIWYLSKYLAQRNSADEENRPKETERPAEEIALEQLDAIKEAKIWQEGQVKEYHTQLTDVIREYIARRFDVRSTEKTSDETLNAMKPLLADNKELYQRLQKMLSLADLVKFAKWNALPDENENSLNAAYRFVHETTPTETADNQPNNLKTAQS